MRPVTGGRLDRPLYNRAQITASVDPPDYHQITTRVLPPDYYHQITTRILPPEYYHQITPRLPYLEEGGLCVPAADARVRVAGDGRGEGGLVRGGGRIQAPQLVDHPAAGLLNTAR